MHRRRPHLWLPLLGAALVFVVACQPEPDATIVVDSFSDGIDIDPGDGTCAAAGGSCTLRAAVMEANVATGLDQILLPAGTYQLDVAGADEDDAATGDLDLAGSTYIEAIGGVATIDAAGLGDRIIDIQGGAWHSLQGLRLINGSVAGDGGAVRAGAGILSGHVELSGNAATGAGGGLANTGGLVSLTRSSITGNTASSGGGASVIGTLVTENTTISANSGGGIDAVNGLVRLIFTTVTDNNGGGVRTTSNPIQLRGSVIANQSTGSDCNGATDSQDHNVDSDNTCGLTQPDDLAAATVILQPLATPGPEHFPAHQPIGLLLLDGVAPTVHGCGVEISNDQHGRGRPLGSGCDIGAVESGQLTLTDFCSFNGIVHDVVSDVGGYFVSGAFTQVSDGSGTNVTRRGLARCTAEGLVDTGFDANLTTEVTSLTIDSPWLYVGGSFDVMVDGTRYRGAARIDISTGTLDATWHPDLVGSVRAVAVGADGVFVGGNMTHLNGQPITRLTKLDAATGAAVPGFSVTIDHSGSWENVLALHVHGSGELFVGGTFDSVNGTSRSSAARLDPTTGAVAAFNPDLTDTNPNDPKVQIEAIVEHQGQIYLCGDWWETEGMGSQADQRNVGRFDPVTGDADLDWLPSISRGLQACAIDASGANLLVGGDHTIVNGQTVGAVHGLSLTTGNVDTSWLPDPTTDVGVKAIDVTAEVVVLGGDVTEASGTSVDNAARYVLG